MKKLFVALYLDEDVSVLVAELLRSHGFDVLTALEAGRDAFETQANQRVIRMFLSTYRSLGESLRVD